MTNIDGDCGGEEMNKKCGSIKIKVSFRQGAFFKKDELSEVSKSLSQSMMQ